MSTVIRVEHVSKKYRLGAVGITSLAEETMELWSKVVRKKKEDLDFNNKANQDKIHWALKDVSFEVADGEVVGVVGKNGAGKSTLLKILSKVTTPTSGTVKIKGRIASLLEVGTGFNPDLSGRENIFLNGAILGLKYREIKAKFDEIVEFSGVEKFIDTPVKRYSSGMYVRLAFAVAAYLEPDILIVDEVLAVGDAEFQKKCLGKMKDVSRAQGRTVLFVSHNMTAVSSLCSTGIFMKNGVLDSTGPVDKIVNRYLDDSNQYQDTFVFENNEYGDNEAQLLSVKIYDRSNTCKSYFKIEEDIFVEMVYRKLKDGSAFPVPNMQLFNNMGNVIFVYGMPNIPELAEKGNHRIVFKIPGNLLNTGNYLVRLAASTLRGTTVHFDFKEKLKFEVSEDVNLRLNDFRGDYPGIIRIDLKAEHALL